MNIARDILNMKNFMHVQTSPNDCSIYSDFHVTDLKVTKS